jgi:DNA processing protein
MTHKNKMHLLYEIGLSLLPGVGDINAKKLIAYCGGAESVFKQNKAALLKIEGVGEKLATAILHQKVLSRAEEEIRFIEKNKIQALFYLDNEYPSRLKQAVDGPIMLYYKGNANLNQVKVLAVVGTRKVTESGKEICDHILSGFQGEPIVIVSGLAYGVDTQAHKSSLKYGLKTIGVLAHGLDRLYPGANRSLAKTMLQQGGLVTDFRSKTKPDAQNFPKRNRIIAGLADATIVIESATKGGSLITADIANGYNRDVFAVPGRPDDKYSKGTNFLIRTNRAALIESARDIRYFMGWNMPHQEKTVQKKLFVDLSQEEETLINIIRQAREPRIDAIAIKAKMPVSKVSALLLKLEFDGLVRCLPGKVFRIV